MNTPVPPGLDSIEVMSIERFAHWVHVPVEVVTLTREALSRKTGIPYSRWHNLMNSRGRIKSAEIEAVGNVWPEYRLWLAYGEVSAYIEQIRTPI